MSQVVRVTEWSPRAVTAKVSILPSASEGSAAMVPLISTSSPAMSSSRLEAESLPVMLSVPPVSRISVSEAISLGSSRVRVASVAPKRKWSPARYSMSCGALKKRYRSTVPAAMKATPRLYSMMSPLAGAATRTLSSELDRRTVLPRTWLCAPTRSSCCASSDTVVRPSSAKPASVPTSRRLSACSTFRPVLFSSAPSKSCSTMSPSAVTASSVLTAICRLPMPAWARSVSTLATRSTPASATPWRMRPPAVSVMSPAEDTTVALAPSTTGASAASAR